LPERKEETLHCVGRFGRQGYRGRSFIVAAAHATVLCIVSHFDTQAGLEVSCCRTFKPRFLIFFASRCRTAESPLVSIAACCAGVPGSVKTTQTPNAKAANGTPPITTATMRPPLETRSTAYCHKNLSLAVLEKRRSTIPAPLLDFVEVAAAGKRTATAVHWRVWVALPHAIAVN
jgi:hypothetical protein